ncbi:MAG: glutaredoxin domain-containing protein [Myxococcota bacterium]|nr:glutaredoxin domain-containing protein [Myxococcota bacterium]
MQQVLLYTAVPCGYCRAAKHLLESLDLAYDEVDLTHDREQRLALMEKTGQRTVPQIFVGDTHVGGFMELRALHLAGGLLPLVNS